MTTNDEKLAGFQISLDEYLLESMIHRWPRFARWLGEWESRQLRSELEATPIDRPIYIAGLARSGSTILLELIARSAAVGSHRYSDFPAIFTPYWWNALQQRSPQREAVAQERAHGDGLLVTAESPEAMEEPLWMAHFPAAHDPAVSQTLSADREHPAFEGFYRDHLKKVLRIRNRQRYASKGNYNLTRLPYLLKLFPDAKLVIPIRGPEQHIASLMKQHRLFVAGETRYPRALRHMQRVGHFEFGLDRRPINADNTRLTEEVIALWRQGDEVRGWARYWAGLYGWVAAELERNKTLRQASLLVRFEDLCQAPRASLDRLFDHCQLEEDLAEMLAGELHAPDYYRPEFTESERAIIAEETEATAAAVGYGALASTC